ncbi:MAG: sugar phosphate nucleotidyltransferase [Candidatus Magasanikbacteria bacterium]
MRIKKAILTGGGRATRLYPITKTINKHLLPLANKPMIFHAIEKVVEAGVEEIFINVNPGDTQLQEVIGDGGHWGIKIKFFEQTGGPQGIAHVVKEAEKFIGNDPFMFYLSDNIILGSIKEMVEEFYDKNFDCMLVLSKVKDPERFGVPKFDESGKLIDVLEKPANPPSDFAVTGIYLYGSKIFFEAYNKIEKSDRGEYEISSVHSHFLKNNLNVGYKEITGWWKDTGLADDLILANKLLLDQLEEKIKIGAGSQVTDNVKLIEPVIIAENCILENCEIGPYVTLGSGCEVKGAKIESSIILENCIINCDAEISNSLIGRGVKISKKQGEEGNEGCGMIVGDGTLLEL